MNQPSPRTLPAYVDRLQQSGRYTFTREEALKTLKLSPVALKHAARRLSHQGRLLSPRRGFFVIVPLEYKSAGSPPPSWFIDQLMKFHRQPYYVGLLSAAALHGAAHQQPQAFQVIVGRQERPTMAGRARIRFILKKNVEHTAVVQMKTETGSMTVSTPESTAIDLVRYTHQVGGLNNVVTVLSELAEKIDAHRLAMAAKHDRNLPAAQRLGLLLEHAGQAEKAEPLARWIETISPRTVTLRPDRAVAHARRAPRWKIIVNEQIEAPE
jgi:predicted transcriptional regulator of viral defense system